MKNLLSNLKTVSLILYFVPILLLIVATINGDNTVKSVLLLAGIAMFGNILLMIVWFFETRIEKRQKRKALEYITELEKFQENITGLQCDCSNDISLMDIFMFMDKLEKEEETKKSTEDKGVSSTSDKI